MTTDRKPTFRQSTLTLMFAAFSLLDAFVTQEEKMQHSINQLRLAATAQLVESRVN